MAAIQRRKGPNVVGIWGFLQPFTDGLKLIIKEIVIPNKSNKFLFIFGSSLTLFLSFIGWVVIPYNPFNTLVVLNTSLLYILVVSSLAVYGILLAGWSSNSKYALLGSLRSVSQMISYEVSISLIVILFTLFAESFGFSAVFFFQMWIILFLAFFQAFYFICVIYGFCNSVLTVSSLKYYFFFGKRTVIVVVSSVVFGVPMSYYGCCWFLNTLYWMMFF